MERKLRNIAVRTRRFLVKISRNLIMDVPDNLAGLCGYGSILLYNELKKAGYKSDIIEGQGHWFILCGGYLMDITATQSGGPKVVVKDYYKTQQQIMSGESDCSWWKFKQVGDIHYGWLGWNREHIETVLSKANKK